MPESNGKTVHVLIRYADRVFGNVDTIGAHQEVLERTGYVWIGKQGRAIGREMMHRLQRQLDGGTATSLYLATHKGGRYRIHKCKLERICRAAPSPSLRQQAIPAYYETQLARFTSWFRVKSIVEVSAGELRDLRGTRSHDPIREVLGKSMSGHFYLTTSPLKKSHKTGPNEGSVAIPDAWDEIEL